MIKKIKVILGLLCACLGLWLAIHAAAANDFVYDQADLLTDEEESRLQEYAQTFSEQWDMNFLVVTTNDAEGKSSMEYADDFYDVCFPDASEEDGILYLIDMDNREIYLSTCGKAIRYLTDSRIEWILDEAFECVADGDYCGTFITFFNETDYYLKQGIPSDQYNYDVNTGEFDYYKEPMRITPGELTLAFVVALIPAVLTVFGIKAKYQLKFEDFRYDAYTDSAVRLRVKSDRLVNKIVTHRRIPRNSGSSGSSSGGGGSRSSVHTSSSGRSHGGGGRKF